MIEDVQRQGSGYSSDDRRMAVIRYVLRGSVRRTAEATGIPVRTLYDWQKTDWWETLVAQVRTEMEGELDANLSKMIHLALDAIIDRLANGDYVVTTKGATVRKPISARDAMAILAMAIEKRQVLRDAMATVPQQRLGNLVDRLRELGELKRNATSPV